MGIYYVACHGIFHLTPNFNRKLLHGISVQHPAVSVDSFSIIFVKPAGGEQEKVVTTTVWCMCVHLNLSRP